MKRIIFLFFLFSANLIKAQTGPGGVGNSSTNSLWLVADDILQVDGTAISSWSDRSGNANNATQATTGRQPRYDSLIVNGHSVVRFDGTDDYFDDARTYNARTFFSVYNIRSGVQQTSDLGQIWGSYSEGWHVSLDARSGGGTWSFDGRPSLNSGNRGRFGLNGAAYGGFGANPGAPNWTYNQFDLVTVEFNATRTLTRQVLGSLVPSFAVGVHQYGGDVAEVVVYNTTLNSAQRIIVDNYLSAKYGLNLTVNDIYNEDDAVNGNYDFDVAGIGRVDASNLHNDAQGSGMVRISNPTGLGDDEFLIWGHDNGDPQSTNITDVPGIVEARFDRIWRVSEVNSSGVAVDVGDINMRWDLSNLGPITASDLRLLIDTDNDGVFAGDTVIAGATNVGGDIYQFTGVSGGIAGITDNRRFTIGTINLSQTPLPVDLISFNAHANEGKVELKWITATEINNDYFTIERSINVKDWEEILVVDGAGNSNQIIEYFDTDYTPFEGVSYYRLKQTDFDGKYTYSNIVPIKIENDQKNGMLVYPNPVEIGEIVSVDFEDYKKEVLLVLRDVAGKEFYSKLFLNIEKGQLIGIPISNEIPAGTYLIIATSENQIYSKKLIIN